MTLSTCFTLALLCTASPRVASTPQGELRAPRELRVEYRAEPVTVDDARPRFSWEIDDPRRAASQSAYQVLVATNSIALRDQRADVWDSGKVLSSESYGIEFAGETLAADRTYSWVVRTWDAVGRESPWSQPASFTVGPRSADAWRADWVRAGRAPESGSIGHKSQIGKAEDDWPWVQFDFGGNVVCDKVVLHPARPDGDASKPGVLFPLRVRVYTDAHGKFEDKSIRIAQYVWQDIPSAGAEPLVLALDSRYTLRYLRIVATKIQPDGDRGFAMALGEIEVLDGAVNIAPRGEVSVSGSSGEPGWSSAALNDGALVPAKQEQASVESLPRLRGMFVVDGPVRSALIHASALGLYELTVNGAPIGDARLAPGWTDYNARVPYQTYDITKYVAPGDNVIGVQLAPGWYAGRIGLADHLGQGRSHGFYGAEPAFCAQGEVVLESGKRIAFQTDTNWRWNRTGPLIAADLLDGETRDLRNETPGWDAPRYQGSDWRPIEVANDLKPTRFAQRAEPIRAFDVRPALSVQKVGDGTFVYDFGQNLSGVVRLRASGKMGDTITLRHAEAVDENGVLYTANLGSAAQTDRFTLRGDVETIEPRFTIHGFRYVEVTGLDAALDLSSIEAVAIGTAVRDIGSFACSDDTLNRVWRAANWSVRSNFVGVPTNCSQRDERLGWMGDLGVVAPTALHAFDAANFLTQWLADVRGAQTSDGRFPDFAPQPFTTGTRFFGGPGWADAGVSVPWEIYLRTHDLRLLRSSTKPAVDWVKFIASKNPDGVWRNERGNDYGDWLNTAKLVVGEKPCEGCSVQKDLFATAFFAHSARTAAKMAFAIGDAAMQQAALEIANNATAAFRREYVKDGRIVGDTQAAYALALDFELYASTEEAEDFAGRLAARVREQGYLTCGFPTAHRALLGLSRFGRHDVALELARRKTLPSWGFMVENGATAMWERWDGFVPGVGFQNEGTNSFNQVALGAIAEWMVREIAGLQLVDTHADSGMVSIDMSAGGPMRTSAEGAAPWSRIRFAPHVGGGLTHAEADHRALTGLVRSAWKLDGDVLTYECTVPPGSNATLDLPAKDEATVALDGKHLAESKALKMRAGPAGTVRIELPSGSYVFRSEVR